jgi:hypothetical protein
MALNSSGPLSLGGSTLGQSVNLELEKLSTAIISLNDSDLRTLFEIPAGTISMSSGYGKSKGPTVGIIAGGATSQTPTTAAITGDIEGIRFSTETSIDVAAGLVTPRNDVAGVNTPLKGYYGGGHSANPVIPSSSNTNQIDGIEFSSLSVIDPAASMVQARREYSSFNSSVRGYFSGGYLSTNFTNQIDGIEFASETTIDPAAAIVQNRTDFGGVNSTTRGYNGGGARQRPGQPATRSDQIDGLDFATETTIDPAAALTQARAFTAAANSLTRGYWVGGRYWPQPTGPLADVSGIEFATESAINVAAGIAQARYTMSGVHSLAKGYFCGGYSAPASGGITTNTSGIQFQTETQFNSTASLAQARISSGGVQNSTT